jgi:hypothetical protein
MMTEIGMGDLAAVQIQRWRYYAPETLSCQAEELDHWKQRFCPCRFLVQGRKLVLGRVIY